jgi:hypothetical protein
MFYNMLNFLIIELNKTFKDYVKDHIFFDNKYGYFIIFK